MQNREEIPILILMFFPRKVPVLLRIVISRGKKKKKKKKLLLFVFLIDNKSGLVSDKSNSTILINTSSFYQIAGLNVLFQSLLF